MLEDRHDAVRHLLPVGRAQVRMIGVEQLRDARAALFAAGRAGEEGVGLAGNFLDDRLQVHARKWKARLDFQNLREFRDILAAAHGEVGLAATLATELQGKFIDDLAGLVTGLDRGG